MGMGTLPRIKRGNVTESRAYSGRKCETTILEAETASPEWSEGRWFRNTEDHKRPEMHLRKHKARKQKGHAQLFSAPRLTPLCPPTPPSPCSSRPRPPPPPKDSLPPPHDLCTQRHAAAWPHPAAHGSAQAGTPPSLLRACACAPSLPRDPLYCTPEGRGATAGKHIDRLLQQNDVDTRSYFSGLNRCVVCISPQMRPCHHQPSEVNQTRSIPKADLNQCVARSWEHGGEQAWIGCFQ